MFEDVRICPLCLSDKRNKYAVVSDRVLVNDKLLVVEVGYVKCYCGFVYTSRMLNPEAMHKYYASQYRATISNGNDQVTRPNILEQRARAAALEVEIKDRLVGGRALDIGSSAGVWLELLRDKYGYSVMGVEPGDAFRAYQQDGEIPVVADIDQVDGAFDLITIIHTLEHVTDPVGLLSKAYELANDGAVLVIEVPDLYAEPTVLRLAHPVAFTRDTLSRAMWDAGWRDISVALYVGTPINSAGRPKNDGPCNVLGIGRK